MVGSPKLVTRAFACESLGICERTFVTHWGDVFTDPRDPFDRVKGKPRRVYADELAAAVEIGGGTTAEAKSAVQDYRQQVGRAHQ